MKTSVIDSERLPGDLATTAADRETLRLHGIQYVILCPRQANQIADHPEGPWSAASEESVVHEPFWTDVGEGKKLAVFFYSGPASQGVAFDGWLHDGRGMADNLADAAKPFVSVATDGESYGHHHKGGDMALAACVDAMERGGKGELTNFARELADAPPRRWATIVDGSSWSCFHGVGRWEANCGCVMDPKWSGNSSGGRCSGMP